MITSLALVLSVSIFIRVVALILTIVLLRRMRDWRMGFLALMLGLMGLQQALTLYQTLSAGGAGVPATTEMPGLVVSILALLTVLFLERLVVQQQREPQTLRESEEKYRQLVELAQEGIWLIDKDSCTTFVNPSMAKMLDYSSDEMIGKHLFSFMDERGIEIATRDVERRQAGISEQHNFEFLRKDGSRIHTTMETAPITDKEGHYAGAIAGVIDVTEQVQAQEALRHSEVFLDSIIEHSPHAMWISDDKGTLIRLNQACCDLLHIRDEEVVGKYNVLQDNIVAEQGLLPLVRQVFEKGEAVKFTLRYDSSQLKHLELAETVFLILDVTISPVLEASGRVTNAIIQHMDITERVRAEEALRDSRNMLETVLDSIPAAVFWKDRDLIYLGGNRTWLEAVGLESSEEVVGKSDYDLPWGKEQADLYREDDRRVMESGIPEHDIIEPYLRADGARAWAKTNKVPLRDTEGHVVGVLGTYEDITERKRAEEELREYRTHLEELVEARTAELNERVTEVEGLNQAMANLLGDLQAAHRKLEETTRQLQRANAEMETFTYSVSHDLKAPLRGIDGYSRLLLQDYAEQLDEEGRAFLHTIRRAAEQMNQLIEDLLAYSRLERRALVRGQVNPRALVETLVAEQAEEIRKRGARLTVEVPCQAVIAEAEGLAQALRNLLGNALKFTRDVPEPRIEIGGRETENSCIIWVRDNGIGFDMQYHDRIFEIFQRLHRAEEYPGTGVGLAIVRKAVERMGGRVWAESAPGQGATFYLEIPR